MLSRNVRPFLISALVLSLTACTVNVYNVPAVSPTPNISVAMTSSQPKTVAPQVVTRTIPCDLESAVAMSHVKPVEKEAYRVSNDERGYVKALEQQLTDFHELTRNLELERARCYGKR